MAALAACSSRRDPPAPDQAVCRQYQAVLTACGAGLPPGFPDEAIVVAQGVPVRARSRPIPRADQDRARAPVDVSDSEAALPAAGAVYVAATASVPALALRDLQRRAPGRELRLLVGRTGEEIVALHAAMFPRTPPALRARLPQITGVTVAAPELIAMSGSCRAVRDAFIPLGHGAPINTLGPGTAEALATCQCRLADLDGYVGLLAWLLLPFPRTGYLAVEPAVLDRLDGRATIGDLIAALP
jgi:hypothetical protein